VETSPAFLAGRRENEISTFWDGLIEYITGHYLDETLEFGNDIEMSDHERLVRLMAGETRFFRRILAKAILNRADRARENAISTLLPSGQLGPSIYVSPIRSCRSGWRPQYLSPGQSEQLKAAASRRKP